MILSIHQPRYWPWLGLLDKVSKSDIFVILDNVEYNSDSFQSRCQIRNKEGWNWMTVPVYKKGRSGQLINEVEIVNNNKWEKKHWMMIKSNYSKANHFEDYSYEVKKIYNKNWKRLSNLNICTMKTLFKLFNINTKILFASNLEVSGDKSNLLANICYKLNANIYLSGDGAKNYLNEKIFSNKNIKVKWQNFKHPNYEQRWKGFEEGMFGLDILFNHGNNSKELLLGCGFDER